MATVALLAMTAMSAATSIAGGVVANQNAKAEAKQQRLMGDLAADDTRRAGRRLIAEQQVAYAGAGIDTQVGTPLDVLGDTVSEIELAALRAQFTGESQAGALERQGQQARTVGITTGVGTILGGAHKYYTLGSSPGMTA